MSMELIRGFLLNFPVAISTTAQECFAKYTGVKAKRSTTCYSLFFPF